jgi:hypothetical protein
MIASNKRDGSGQDDTGCDQAHERAPLLVQMNGWYPTN